MKSFFALTAKARVIEIVRWVCVVPIAILGDYVGFVIGGMLGSIAMRVGLVNPPSDDSSFNRALRYLIWMFPEGLVCVIAATKMAPRSQRLTACIVAGAWMLLVDRIHGFEGPTLIATAVSGGCGVACIFYIKATTRDSKGNEWLLEHSRRRPAGPVICSWLESPQSLNHAEFALPIGRADVNSKDASQSACRCTFNDLVLIGAFAPLYDNDVMCFGTAGHIWISVFAESAFAGHRLLFSCWLMGTSVLAVCRASWMLINHRGIADCRGLLSPFGIMIRSDGQLDDDRLGTSTGLISRTANYDLRFPNESWLSLAVVCSESLDRRSW
jgi:hypothetical protein